MPVLVDGNNLLFRLPPPQRSRREVRRLTLASARQRATKVTVVFDGPPPPGVPARENLGAVTVVYSEERSADEVILSRLPNGPAVKTWVVVTDDRDLARRVRTAGAAVRRVAEWRARLDETGEKRPADEQLSADEVRQWQRYFEAGRDD